jgi:hypothetical protein
MMSTRARPLFTYGKLDKKFGNLVAIFFETPTAKQIFLSDKFCLFLAEKCSARPLHVPDLMAFQKRLREMMPHCAAVWTITLVFKSRDTLLQRYHQGNHLVRAFLNVSFPLILQGFPFHTWSVSACCAVFCRRHSHQGSVVSKSSATGQVSGFFQEHMHPWKEEPWNGFDFGFLMATMQRSNKTKSPGKFLHREDLLAKFHHGVSRWQSFRSSDIAESFSTASHPHSLNCHPLSPTMWVKSAGRRSNLLVQPGTCSLATTDQINCLLRLAVFNKKSSQRRASARPHRTRTAVLHLLLLCPRP